GFSGAYLAELAGRFVSAKALAVLAAAAVAYAVIARFVRLDVFVVVAMLVLPFVAGKGATKALPETTAAGPAKGAAPPAGPDAMLAEFLRKEAARAVAFAKPPDGRPDFGLVF